MPGTFRLLLPALLPSWRFFSGVGPSPRIEIRGADGLWRELAPRPAHVPVLRMLRRLAWNPRWNGRLYLVSLAERMVEEPTAHSLSELRSRIPAELPPGTPPPAAFRLTFVFRRGDRLEREVLWSSEDP
ncbi:hypothetical protein [Mangrovicoccus sp. HB161399]|uniref:hypothetical protein n=1 Tax=Mangrovicoccus sp. HB161399 TaxID=2720392 RepID=UPI0015574CCB|nr:hypothetical protein [Mangrovicoccus sp. HB161399]